jgi:hypothetical protein
MFFEIFLGDWYPIKKYRMCFASMEEMKVFFKKYRSLMGLIKMGGACRCTLKQIMERGFNTLTS